MAKKMSPVDTALEISRKVNVPKKPVKAKGKKTVPSSLDWGPGIPEDKLAYLNDEEMALLQAHRMFKGKRSFDGIPAFPDVGDTAAGGSTGLKDGASTKGTTSSGGLGQGGQGGQGGGNSAGDSGGGRSGTGSSSSSAAGGGSSPSGSQSKDNSKTSTSSSAPSSGPDRGPTGGPARTAPSTAGTPNSAKPSPDSPVSRAPSNVDYQGALDRIARGSSVVGNPSNQKQFTDRVPQAAPTNYSQSTTVAQDPSLAGRAAISSSVSRPASYQPSDMAGKTRGLSGLSGPNQGLGAAPAAPGNFSQPDYSIGGNGPLADPSTPTYDRNAYDKAAIDAAVAAAKNVGPTTYLGPSVPAGSPITGPAGRYPGSASYQTANALTAPTMPAAPAAPAPIGVNPTLYSSPINISQPARTVAQDPSLTGRAAAAKTLGQELAYTAGAAANTIGNYIGTAAQNVGDYVGGAAQTATDYAKSLIGGNPSATAALSPSINPQTGLPAGQKITDRVPTEANFVDTHAYGPGSVYSADDAGLAQASMNNVVNGSVPSGAAPAKNNSFAAENDALARASYSNIVNGANPPNTQPASGLVRASDLAKSAGPNTFANPDAYYGALNNVSSTVGPQTVSSFGPALPAAQKTRSVSASMTANPSDFMPMAPQNTVGAVNSYSGGIKAPASQTADAVPAATNIYPASASAAVNYDAYKAALAKSKYSNPPTQLTQYDPTLARSQTTTVPSWKQGGTYNPPAAPSQQGYGYDVSPSQGDIAPSQQGSWDVSPSQGDISPSQQSGWSTAQRDSYLKSVENGHDREIGKKAPTPPTGAPTVATKPEPKSILAPLPPWHDYSYLYTDYPDSYGPSQNITDFNNYLSTYWSGGRVGDSVDSALRLARRTVVKRKKTR